MRARTMVTIAAVGGVLAAAVGVGAFALHSPDERITTTLPETVLTATVEKATLTTELTGVGTFEPAGTVRVSAAPPVGMAGVVSATPRAVGEALPWCAPLVEVSGRPVLVLHGDLPAWRDLTVGDTGSDVRQLQAALRECGSDVLVDGVFGEYTARAVKALYADAGYAAVTSAGLALGGAMSATDASTASTSTDAASGHVVNASLVASPELELEPGPPPGPTSEPTPAPPPPAVIAPRGELLFLSTPGRLTAVDARGTVLADDPVATVALAGDQFQLSLSAAQRNQVLEGLTITVTRDDWSLDVALPALPALPETATTDANGLPSFPVSVPLSEPLPGAFYGQPGQFSVVIGSPDPYDCVVPVSAIYQDVSGQPYVLRARGGASRPGEPEPSSRVDVEVLASAGGYSAVRPLTDQALHTGDEVVIGE